MTIKRNCLALLIALSVRMLANGQTQAQPPHVEISNGLIHVKLYLPDPERGYYRGTRFDWSGVIASLEYQGHNYYGPWFTKTDPKIRDFIYDGPDIVAGPCSAISGPVEEFSSHAKALGYDEAKVGGSFLKIGVGVLRKPDDEEYSAYRLYRILDSGKRGIRTSRDSVEFSQQLADPDSGYSYLYTKTVKLAAGKPEMIVEHRLKNTGRRPIQTSVYDHNFLVLDRQPTGPDFAVTVPFQIKPERPLHSELAEIRGNQFIFLKVLQGRDTFESGFSGFSNSPSDYNIKIENKKVGAGMQITGDRPLSAGNLWSIRSVLAMEPFIGISVEPGQQFTWKYTYTYYTLPH